MLGPVQMDLPRVLVEMIMKIVVPQLLQTLRSRQRHPCLLVLVVESIVRRQDVLMGLPLGPGLAEIQVKYVVIR